MKLDNKKLASSIVAIFLVMEVIALLFCVVYWKELQTTLAEQPKDSIGQTLFQSALVLGYLRTLVICAVPLLGFMLTALSYRILFSDSLKAGPLEFATASEKLNQTEVNMLRMNSALDELRTLRQENEALKQLSQTLVFEKLKRKEK
ncbi:MAG: hypothetical protein HY966_02690 [Ignavibacteriales bacterium]|nr:hypothetical protein [Ignavibacteriales bacterium]